MVRQSQFCFSNGIEGVIVAIEARIYIYIYIYIYFYIRNARALSLVYLGHSSVVHHTHGIPG